MQPVFTPGSIASSPFVILAFPIVTGLLSVVLLAAAVAIAPAA